MPCSHIEQTSTYATFSFVKKTLATVFCILLLVGCSTKVDADFFKLTLPGRFKKNQIGSAIQSKMAFSTKPGKVELINDLTSESAYIMIDWQKRDIAQGKASSVLGIGTLPVGSIKILESTKLFSGVMSWEETVVVMDEKKTAELRWLYHIVIPLDGGVLDILCSIAPNKAILKEIQDSISTIEITDKGFFKK
jgi:hypothetical protein